MRGPSWFPETRRIGVCVDRPPALARLPGRSGRPFWPGAELSRDLTQREREVIALVAEGRTNGGIAERMVITEGSVQKFVR
jgi:DNA-binding NarL/FixJ family response regulator